MLPLVPLRVAERKLEMTERKTKPLVAIPVYTPSHPAPFERELERFAPKETSTRLSIHPGDGTACVLPYCQKVHDEYVIRYKRVSVMKVLEEKGD